ncbi:MULTISPECIES: ABC transporter substrate-binding protein [unclassified Bacillus (in: firmicutes)]|uniref:ABC transporter substrate-binding protein n=1 Tax=unclassified Bacillus (in: firmicutes) TaxID=185979 RepID=UPI0008E54884|nr:MULTISPECIES: ABC transporter substrate-binding protein [unclassified Bacillus (in: firmicutes)]SFA88479.1 putative ABC transport system substrate-binding protein [Bacillus sp. UNCCL13]SFQ84623.1 putative ABC transport system substrate-binding protein [Bacillus sp. cl95]
MKKYVRSCSIVLASLLLLAGCGTNEKTGSSGEKEKAEKTYTIGITQFAEHPSLDAATEGFKKALADNGFKEGENVKFDVQNAQADMNNTQTIANNFVGDKVDLIFANATPSAVSALNATKDIPIVFTSVTDPVGAGLVKAFDQPGENITGTTDNHPDATAKTIHFITDEIKAKKIGVVYNSGEQNSVVQVEAVKKLAEEKGAKLVEVSVSTSAEVKQAAESLAGRVDAIYIPTDNTVVSALESVISVANDKKLPLFVGELDSMKRGAIAASGFNYFDLGYETGEMAAEILKGKKPSEIPVALPQSLKLVINKKAAASQGVEVQEAWSSFAEFFDGE